MAKPFDLAVGEWWQVPRVGNSHLADVYATPSPGGDQTAIMNEWSGGCVDTSRLDLLIWGGGHGGYAGNEVYAFELDNFVWRRKSFYSTPLNDNSESNADGSPAARHTYAGLCYDATRDTLVVAAGGFLAGPAGVRSNFPWEFNCTNETPNASAPGAWLQKDIAPDIPPDTVQPFSSMAFDTATGKYYSQHQRGLARFSPGASPGSQWETLTTFEGSSVLDVPVAIAPISPSQIIWPSTVATGQCFGRRLDTNAYIGTEGGGLPVTGDLNILDVDSPGIGWEPVAQKMILWGGLATGGTDRRDVYKLDLGTKVVTRVAGSGDIPDAPSVNGTFGRWAYLGGCGLSYSGLWVLVNSTTSDVYFYRSSGGAAGSPKLTLLGAG